MRYLFIFIFIHSMALAQVVPVEIIKSDKGYELIREGKPYYIKGVGGLEYLEKAKEFISDVDLNYTKHYIGFKVKNRANNFSLSRPQKGGVKLSIRLPKSDDTNEKISSAELDILNYFR